MYAMQFSQDNNMQYMNESEHHILSPTEKRQAINPNHLLSQCHHDRQKNKDPKQHQCK
jgi:hypothetical protein